MQQAQQLEKNNDSIVEITELHKYSVPCHYYFIPLAVLAHQTEHTVLQ